MNICFIIGKVISNIEYKFVLNSKNTAIATFKIELENKSIIIAKAYNQIADYCYRNLAKENTFLIKGYIYNKGIIAEEIYKFIPCN